jgi:hypothetical protein
VLTGDETIASRRLKQAQAANLLRVTQPRVGDLLRGRIDLFTTDSLIDMLARLGVGVRLVPGNFVRNLFCAASALPFRWRCKRLDELFS